METLKHQTAEHIKGYEAQILELTNQLMNQTEQSEKYREALEGFDESLTSIKLRFRQEIGDLKKDNK